MNEFAWIALIVFAGLVGWFLRGKRRPVLASVADPVRLKSNETLTNGVKFRVATKAGVLCYEGRSGANAKREIEKLRSEGQTWQAFRDGGLWDWGPR